MAGDVSIGPVPLGTIRFDFWLKFGLADRAYDESGRFIHVAFPRPVIAIAGRFRGTSSGPAERRDDV